MSSSPSTQGASLSRRLFASLLSLATALAVVGIVAVPARAEAIFTVRSTGDASDESPGDGTCSSASLDPATCTLRAAIEEANVSEGPAAVDFNIDSEGQTVISPLSDLPPLTNQVLIDGTTQPGYDTEDPAPLIRIDGTDAGEGPGFQMEASDSTIKGLSITGFAGGAIAIIADSGLVRDNYLGVDPDGITVPGNGTGGVTITDATGVEVNRNVISGDSGDGGESGESGDGIRLDQADSADIHHNIIGLDASGDAIAASPLSDDFGNIGYGIEAYESVGVTIGPGNTISGNNLGGIRLWGTTDASVVGNIIGLGTDAVTPLGNPHGFGIELKAQATNGGDNAGTTIGGTAPVDANIIGDNGWGGIVAINALGAGPAVVRNLTIQGNYVGTTLSGDDVGNGGEGRAGIVVTGDGDNHDILIGGTAAGAGNTIAYNGGDGVTVGGAAPDEPENQVRILANSIHDNGGLGINLNPSTEDPSIVTANDGAPDADSGPNDLQNFPDLATPTTTSVDFSLASAPDTDYRIDVFENTSCDPSGYGEGQNPLTSTEDTSDGAGLLSGQLTFGAVSPGAVLTATATNVATGETSEFSSCVEVPVDVPGADLDASQSHTPDPVNGGANLTFHITVTNDGPLTATNVQVTDTLPNGSTFKSANPSIGSCSGPVNVQFTCALGSLGNDTSASIDLVVGSPTSVPSGHVTNVVDVTSDVADPTPANNHSAEDANVTSISGPIDISDTPAGPLTNVWIGGSASGGQPLTCQVAHAGDSAYEWYNPGSVNGDCGTWLYIAGTVNRLFGPTPIASGWTTGQATPWSNVTVSAVNGTGTTANPYKLVTTADAGSTGISIVETDRYVIGDESYRTDVKILNASGSALAATLYRAGDCYLQGNDQGYGLHGGTTPDGLSACQAGLGSGRIEGFSPITLGSSYYEDTYYSLWGRFVSNPGAAFPNTVNGNLVDNGVGVSWPVSIADGDNATFSALSSYSPSGRLPIATSLAASSPTVAPGGVASFTLTLSNPNAQAASLNSIVDTLPAGFTYVAGSSTGITTSDPAVSGRTLTWTGLLSVPAQSGSVPGTATLTFQTTAASTPGDYTDNVSADGGIFDVVPALSAISVEPQVTTLSNLSLAVSPSTAPAGFAAIGESGLNLAGASLDGGVLAGSAGPQAAPLGKNPLGKNPLGKNPLGKNPLGKNPLGKNPLGKNPLGKNGLSDTLSPLRDAPVTSLLPLNHTMANPPLLTDMPIGLSGGWPAVLHTSAPLQTLTLNDAITNPAWSSLKISDIDWSQTVFADFSSAAWLLGKATPSDIAGPSWGSLTSQMGSGCTSSMSFTDLQLNRCDLTVVPWDQIPLSSIAGFAGTPLGRYHLDGILLSYTPLGDILTGAAPAGMVMCTACGPDLAHAQDVDGISHTSLLSDLSNAQLAGVNLDNLLPGMTDVTGYPYEAMTVAQLIGAADTTGQPTVTYTAGMDMTCPGADGAAMTVQLPNGRFRYVEGSGQFTIGALPSAATSPASDGHGDLTFDLPASPCTGQPFGTVHVTLTIAVVPGPNTGAFTAGLAANAPGADSASLSDQAPLTVHESQETGDAVGSATPIAPNTLYTGTISSSGDEDFFTIPLSTADTPPGTRVAVYLSHLTQDDDLVLYGPSASAASLHAAPLGKNPLGKNPVDDSSSCLPQDYSVQPQTLQDVTVASDPSLAVRGFSTNRSTQEEISCAIVNEQDSGHLTVQVSGFNGTSGDQPYVLRYVVVAPPASPACQPITLGTGGTVGTMPASIPSTTQTLILVNAKRFGDTYGASAESATLTSLNNLANSPIVNGKVIPVETNGAVASAYTALNGSPCSPAAANGVVRAINASVDGLRTANNLSDLRFIVLVGSDNIIPLGRVADLTALGNQSEYQGDVRLQGGLDNPISRAFAQGFVLSDDPYGSFSPIAWNGNQVYVPAVSTGRLVETPSEIQGQVAQFLSSNGRLTPSSALVTGYDFTSDSANAIKSALTTNLGGTPRSLISDTWSASDLTTGLNAGPRVVALNGHFDHFRTQTANGDILSTTQYLGTNVPQQALLFTLGCNAGVSFPDVWVTSPTNKSLDWAQAQAQRTGELIGNTGFGYGDDTTIAYSERLMTLYAQNLNGSMSAGQALAVAKSQYYAGLAALGSYDVKAMEESTFYGLPMYRMGATGVIAGGGTPPVSPAAKAGHTTVVPGAVTSDGDTGLSVVNLHVPNFIDPSADQRNGSPTTDHYFVGPNTQVSQYRPIEPVSEPIDMTKANRTLHDGLVTSLTVSDVTNFNPVMTVPTLDNSNDQAEPLVTDVAFPTDFVSTAAVQGPFGRQDYLVIDGGRYVSDPGTPGKGTQRVYSSEDVRAFYSNSNDFTRPQYDSVRAFDLGTSTGFAVDMLPDTTGDRNVAVYVMYRAGAGGSFTLKPLVQTSPNHWTASVPGTVTEYFVQAVDQNGNIGVSTFKGLDQPVTATGGTGNATVHVSGTQIPGGWFTDSANVTISSTNGESFMASVDGAPQIPVGSGITLTGDGPHTVTYAGSLGSSGTEVVPVDSAAPQGSMTLGDPKAGPPYVVGQTTPVTVNVSDASSGISSCSIHVSGPATSNPACVGGSNTFLLGTAGGIYTVALHALDNASHTLNTTFTVSLDATGPTVSTTVGSPSFTSGGTIYIKPSTTLSVTASDASAGVNTCAISFTGTASGTRACNPAITNTFTLPATDGPYTVKASAVDMVGNTGTAPDAHLFVDGTAPSVSLALGAPTAGTAPYVGTATPINVVVSDTGSGFPSCTINITGPANSARPCAAGLNTFTIASATGNYVVAVHAVDAVGNVADRSFTVSLDATGPTVSTTVGSPSFTSGGTIYIKPSTTLSVTASDASAGVNTCAISFTGTSSGTRACNPAITNTFTLPATDGPYTVKASAVDKVGNTGAALDKSVSVDGTAPVFGSCPALPVSIYRGSVVPLTITAGDGTGSGLDTAASALTQTLPTSVPGAASLTFTAKDRLGNTSTKVCAYQVVLSLTITADAKTKQYSDADPALTYQITQGSLAAGDSVTGSLTRLAGQTPGTYAISKGSLAVTGAHPGSNYVITFVGASLTIAQEDAFIQYSGDQIAAVNTNLTLRATVWDSAAAAYPGLSAETGASATIGDITKMYVAFDLYPGAANCGTGTPTTLGPFPVTDTGTLGDGVGSATTTFRSATETDFCLVARVVGQTSAGTPNAYYTATTSATTALNFYSNSGRFVAGSGFIADPTSSNGKGAFGLVARNGSNGKPQGEMVYVYPGMYNGTAATFIIKSSALTGLAFTGSAYPLSTTLQGKATIQIYNSRTGASLYSDTGATFTSTAVDSGQSSGTADTFALKVLDKNGVVFRNLSATHLSAGNIFIRLS